MVGDANYRGLSSIYLVGSGNHTFSEFFEVWAAYKL